MIVDKNLTREQLYEQYTKLIWWMEDNHYCFPLWLIPYSDEERALRNKLCPTFWTSRDWLDYNIERGR